MGAVIADRYELEELIGSGGMSNVYRAYDRQLERRVAIKMLHEHYGGDEDYVERFRREARAAAQLSHPNIVTVIDRGESDGRQFIVFEYVEGETLKDYVARQGRLPVKEALELAVDIGKALGFAHENGLVHRDVKPQNVLLADGRPKVADFGIVLVADQGLTQTGTVLGTSDYIAPEQATGLGATEQSDIYSLAALLYELLTGEVMYKGDGFVQVAMRHVHDPAPNVLESRPEVPVRVANALSRALEKEPEKRFPSMEAFVAELRACLQELGPTESQRTAIMRAPSKARRQPAESRRRGRLRPLAFLLAAALVVAAAAGATYYLLDRRDGDAGAVTQTTTRTIDGEIRISGVGAFDPEGDGSEYDDQAADATDGNRATFWRTERYASDDFGRLKSGVGLVLDTGRPVRVSRLVVETDTPGFLAIVKAGSSAEGSFTDVSRRQRVLSKTTFELDGEGEHRYYLLWLTRLPPGERIAYVNEVTAG